MGFRRLVDFLERLDQAGELARVESNVLPALEAAEIVRRAALQDGPAVCFGSLEGCHVPLVANLLGSERRIRLALEVDTLDQVVARIDALLHPQQAEGWFERLKTPPYVAAMESLPPRVVRSGACQQVVRLGSDVDLERLPMLQAAADEPRGSMTGAILFTADPASGRLVTGRCPLERVDRTRLVARLDDHDEMARLVGEYARRQQAMPLAAVLGGDPLLALAASMPSSPGADACRLAALLREKPLDVVKCRSVELEVPAEAELVLEGHIEPAEPWCEAGPLATATGYYRPAGRGPIVHLTAMTERANPVVQALVAGPPPNEESVMRQTLARILLPVARLSIAGLVDYDLRPAGASRHVAVMAIEKRYAGQAHSAVHAAWGSHWLRFVRLMTVVDAEVDVRDPVAVERAVAAHFDPARDLIVGSGPPDPMDPAARGDAMPQRLALDATRKLPGEGARVTAQAAVAGEVIARKVTARWPEYKLGSK
ncbi:MAG: UbiD family decarboxylase [Patescibacteria group bacterium]|nr:UbiD family decarboxylase [Patescibacteria group bacterium]